MGTQGVTCHPKANTAVDDFYADSSSGIGEVPPG
jgi:hypothetical protein